MPYPRSYNVPTRMIQRDMCGWSILEITDLHCGLWTRWGGRLPHKIAHTRRCTCMASVQIARFWRCVLRACGMQRRDGGGDGRGHEHQQLSERYDRNMAACTTGPRDSWTGDQAARLRIPGEPCHGFETG
jgi:hypothetical protein